MGSTGETEAEDSRATLQSWTMAQPGRLNNFSPEIRMEPDDP